MERLGNTRSSGLHAGNLRAWGMLFAIAGIISRGLLQRCMLGVGTASMAELMEKMQTSEMAMGIATVALVLQAVETVAVPIFVFLLAEGLQHTSDFKKYVMRIAVLAVATEIPFDLAMSGKFSAHKLRHTAATMMLSGGVDVKTVQEVLGHENLNTTQIYTHIENTELKLAAEANPLSKLDFSK